MDAQEPRQPAPVICVFDENMPGSVINSMPKRVAQKMRELRDDPLFKDILGLDERRLREVLQKKPFCWKPKPVDFCIRANFWKEWECSIKTEVAVEFTRVYGPVVNNDFFYKFYLDERPALLFMLTPPIPFDQALNESLQYGIEILRKILERFDNNQETARGRSGLNHTMGIVRLLGELSGKIQARQSTLARRSDEMKRADIAEKESYEVTEMEIDARRERLNRKLSERINKEGLQDE